MKEKFLFVDDEPRILTAYQRSLRKFFNIDIAPGGEQALAMIDAAGPYAVIVADMRMPGMNGIELLKAVKARAPSTVRMMLTGNADQQTAIDAVNEGDVFRFLTKPCPPEGVAKALTAGLTQYRLIRAEQELLQQTLAGSIRALADVLSLVNPEAFGRTTRLKRLLRSLAEEMGLPELWRFETLGLLSQIGCVVVPEGVLAKVYRGQALDAEESQLFDMHSNVGADLLAGIPRMEEIARAIRYQEKNYDGTGIPADAVTGDDIPVGARLLKIVLDFDKLEASGLGRSACLLALRRQRAWYAPPVLNAFERMVRREELTTPVQIELTNLDDGMVFAEDVKSHSGVLVVCKGQEVTAALRRRLASFMTSRQIPSAIRVLPAKTFQDERAVG